jgi:hypothetical protein
MNMGRRYPHAVELEIALGAGVVNDRDFVVEIVGGTGYGIDAHVAHAATITTSVMPLASSTCLRSVSRKELTDP